MSARRPVFLAAAAIAISQAASAVTPADQPGAIELSLPLSVRQYGMGGVATGGNDVLRAWSNPAQLAAMSSQGEGALVGGKVLEETTMFGLGGGWRLMPDLAVGAMVVRYAFTMDGVDGYGDPTNTTVEQSVMGAGVLAAYRTEFLRGGVAFRYVAEKIVDTTASGIAADAGVQATFMGATLGLAARNLGPNLVAADEPAEVGGVTTPLEIRAGVAYRYEPLRLGAGAEFSKVVERDGRIGLGLEYWPVEFLGLRAGSSGLKDAGQLTFGFSALWQGFGLDYGVALHSTGINHRLALSYALAGTAAAASPRAAETPRPEPVAAAAPAPAPKPGAKKLNIAIAELGAQNIAAGNAAVIADMLRGELVKTGTFTVVEKQNMDKILAEHSFQQTGCTSEECAVKLGKLLNVQRMVVGSFGLMIDTYMLNIRVVNVETGEVAYADSAEGKSVPDLKGGVRELAKRMASQLR